jgi:putative membrane protein
MRTFKDFFILFLKGLGMGSADVVPGVSGGTIAFITGIYEELLRSINSFDATAFQLLFSFKIKEFWHHVNASFLFPLILGILLSALSLAKVIAYLLEQHPIQLWSFFFGLIIISSISVAKEIDKWSFVTVLSGLIGVVMAYFITVITPASTPDDLWFIFICGAIAICAMILPGISGSFILLILGKYTFIITSLKDFNTPVIAVFVIGCIIGLFTFSRLIAWFLAKFHFHAIALLAGFMLGSLNKIWPWKVTELFRLNSHGEQVPLFERNIFPTEYFAETGNSPMIIQAVLFMALGFMIVVIMEKIALRIQHSKNKKA